MPYKEMYLYQIPITKILFVYATYVAKSVFVTLRLAVLTSIDCLTRFFEEHRDEMENN